MKNKYASHKSIWMFNNDKLTRMKNIKFCHFTTSSKREMVLKYPCNAPIINTFSVAIRDEYFARRMTLHCLPGGLLLSAQNACFLHHFYPNMH